jgi:hypothetical protein
MSNLYKTAALFFAAMLFIIGTCTQNYGLLLTSNIHNAQSEKSDSYYSTEKPEFLFLFRNDERQINSGRNLPEQCFKNYSKNIQDNSLSPEIRLLSINSGYLSYSAIFERSLTNSDIVFPYHYFW